MTASVVRRGKHSSGTKAVLAAAVLVGACAPVVTSAGVPSAAAPNMEAAGGGGLHIHQYQRVDREVTFEQARDAAAAMTRGNLRGHLAVFESPGYAAELEYVHRTVYAPGAPNHRVYWVGAYRPASPAAGIAGWTWLDGSPVPPAITSTWLIDFFEGQVAEGAGLFWLEPPPRLGDYATTNPSKLVSGYIVEFE